MEKTFDSNLQINKLKKRNVLKNLINIEILKIQTKIRKKTEFRACFDLYILVIDND